MCTLLAIREYQLIDDGEWMMKLGLKGVAVVLFGMSSFTLQSHEAESPIMPVVDVYTGWETRQHSLSEVNELPI
jgi:hypothetical protein